MIQNIAASRKGDGNDTNRTGRSEAKSPAPLALYPINVRFLFEQMHFWRPLEPRERERVNEKMRGTVTGVTATIQAAECHDESASG